MLTAFSFLLSGACTLQGKQVFLRAVVILRMQYPFGWVLLYVHRNCRLIRDGSSGWPLDFTQLLSSVQNPWLYLPWYNCPAKFLLTLVCVCVWNEHILMSLEAPLALTRWGAINNILLLYYCSRLCNFFFSFFFFRWEFWQHWQHRSWRLPTRKSVAFARRQLIFYFTSFYLDSFVIKNFFFFFLTQIMRDIGFFNCLIHAHCFCWVCPLYRSNIIQYSWLFHFICCASDIKLYFVSFAFSAECCVSFTSRGYNLGVLCLLKLRLVDFVSSHRCLLWQDSVSEFCACPNVFL